MSTQTATTNTATPPKTPATTKAATGTTKRPEGATKARSRTPEGNKYFAIVRQGASKVEVVPAKNKRDLMKQINTMGKVDILHVIRGHEKILSEKRVVIIT